MNSTERREKSLDAMLLADFYKTGHRLMVPEKTEITYDTWTARTSRIDGVNRTVVYGLQHFNKKYLIDYFAEHFFEKPIEEIAKSYQRIIKNTLLKFDESVSEEDVDTSHIEELHSLGYLPLCIRALPEGTLCPIRVPYMVMYNTDKRFPWLVTYIESLFSCEAWQATTSATIAYEFRKMLDKFALDTVGNVDFVPFQAHDFSMRGMTSLESAIKSGQGHLLSFVGTDTIPSIVDLEKYYNADVENELVGTSVYATEHSIQCAYNDDYEYIRSLIEDKFPTGIISIVCDGYDFWNVITVIIPQLKEKILDRNGKLVLRPDSGNPADIVCGTFKPHHRDYKERRFGEEMGLIESLWEIFGGTVNSMGYKELDPHIGAIYGDGITYERAREICQRLKDKGFASTNVVFGVGSFTYQYQTRDTFGHALKTTYNMRDGEHLMIFKDPKTDDGTKKSLKGTVIVKEVNGELVAFDGGVSVETTDPDDLLVEIFRDGEVVREYTLEDIRTTLATERLLERGRKVSRNSGNV
jgi:nicotinamide phosphoribosyltransferase